jgi:type IX secretion system PorP/SprF family membrane protein
LSIKSRCLKLSWLIFFVPGTLVAQDYSAYTQFFINPAFLNPSYTGIDGRPAVYGSFRKQWLGMNGSPTLGSVSFQTPVDNNVGIGVNAINDAKGLISTSTLSFTGAYALSIAKDQMIRFGLSVGAGFNKLDIDQMRAVTPNDPTLISAASNNIQMMGNAGASYHTKTFHIGFTLPSLFEPIYVSENPFNASIKPFGNVVIHTSNRFYFSKDKNVFEPYLIYRIRAGLPSQFEVAGLLHLQNKGWIGASFRQEYGISALLGFKVSKQLALGYSYSLGSGGDTGINRPSHEIHLALLLGEHKRGVPMYSFLDTEKEKVKKPTPAEIARKKKEEEEKKSLEEEAKKAAAAAAAAAALAEQQEEARLREEARAKHDQQVRDSLVVAHSHEEEQEKLKRLQEHMDDSIAAHEKEVHPSEEHPHAERHEFVKRGTHTDEMDLNDYVIVGAFRAKPNAERFAKGLRDMKFTEVDYGFISARNIWYVYMYAGNDLTEVRAQRDKYRKMTMFKDAWLLTVHE